MCVQLPVGFHHGIKAVTSFDSLAADPTECNSGICVFCQVLQGADQRFIVAGRDQHSGPSVIKNLRVFRHSRGDDFDSRPYGSADATITVKFGSGCVII